MNEKQLFEEVNAAEKQLDEARMKLNAAFTDKLVTARHIASIIERKLFPDAYERQEFQESVKKESFAVVPWLYGYRGTLIGVESGRVIYEDAESKITSRIPLSFFHLSDRGVASLVRQDIRRFKEKKAHNEMTFSLRRLQAAKQTVLTAQREADKLEAQLDLSKRKLKNKEEYATKRAKIAMAKRNKLRDAKLAADANKKKVEA